MFFMFKTWQNDLSFVSIFFQLKLTGLNGGGPGQDTNSSDSNNSDSGQKSGTPGDGRGRGDMGNMV